jgi:hypothetical protein
MNNDPRNTLLDAYEHGFRLAGAFQPLTNGVLYRMLVVESFSDSFLLHVHLREDAPATAKLYCLRDLGRAKPNWIMTTLRCMDKGEPLPAALPDEADPNIEERPLSATQRAWFAGEIARIDTRKLVDCGPGTARDGYERRCWICRPDAPDHVFDESHADERQFPDVFAFARAVYRTGASVLRARFSLGCLVPHQVELFRDDHARRVFMVQPEHYLLEHYAFELVE